MLHRFLRYELDSVTLAVAKNPATDLQTISALFRTSLALVLAEPEPEPPRIDRFSGQKIWPSMSNARQVLGAVGRNAALPMTFLERLWTSNDLDLQVMAGSNPSLPANVVEAFALAESFRLRRAVASHQSISVDSLVRLARDEDEGVRRAVAGNERTPVPVLYQLSDDESRVVQQALRSNPNITVVLREKLHVAYEGVPRAASPINPKLVASLPTTPAEFEEFLTHPDFNETYWLYLASSADTPFAHVIGRVDDVMGLPIYPQGVSPKLYAARHVGTPESQLELLATSEDAQVRRAAAQTLAMISTNYELLQSFVRDVAPPVREAVANGAGSAFQESLWNELANDAEADVRSAVLNNAHAPDVIRAIARMNELAEGYGD
jgi:hypothetical protein